MQFTVDNAQQETLIQLNTTVVNNGFEPDDADVDSTAAIILPPDARISYSTIAASMAANLPYSSRMIRLSKPPLTMTLQNFQGNS